MSKWITMVGALLFCGSGWASPNEFEAKSFINPVFEERGQIIPEGTGAIPAIEKVRVQVFPHIAKYTSPHGRDTIIGTVKLQSKGACTLFLGGKSVAIPAERILTFRAEELASPQRLECSDVTQVIRETGLTSRKYEGDFVISRDRTEQGVSYVQVINILPFDSYIKGVVPSEMPAWWPEESLKVQAVAARTYAYFEVMHARQNFPERNFDVDDTIQYQAYRGKQDTPVSDRAVEGTAGEVLVYNDSVAKAYFDADSGGHTEDAENVWPDGEPAPYCRGRAEIYDLALVDSTWTYVIPYDEMNRRLIAVGVVSSENPVVRAEIQPGDFFPSGRANVVTLQLRSGSLNRILATRFQFWMGLRSTFFTMTDTGSGVALKGLGRGHGSGMSQWGAKVLFESLGWDYRSILGFYYNGIEVRRLD